MVSKQCIQMMGLQVNVFGLEEYKKLPSNTPVGVMFGLHGKLNDQTQLDKSCQALCKINEKRKPMDRYIIAATFDGPNHGSRALYTEDLEFKKMTIEQSFAFGTSIYTHSVEESLVISQLIDVFELYAFGPHHKRLVEKWGVISFSLGAHAVFMAIGRDPRITTFISIAGTPNLIGLVKSTYPAFRVPEDFSIRTIYYGWADSIQKNIYKNLNNVHLLALYGGKDKIITGINEDQLITALRENHPGRENQDWKVINLPQLGHYISSQCIAEAVQWTDRWMVRREPELTAKL